MALNTAFMYSITQPIQTATPPFDGPPECWSAIVIVRLQRQWPTIDRAQLLDVLLELWCNERLRALPADQAAAEWLVPVVVTG